MDAIREILVSNDKFHLDHRYNCESCEGEYEGDNCVWFYDTAEDWYYDNYIFNCHTCLDGGINFEELNFF